MYGNFETNGWNACPIKSSNQGRAIRLFGSNVKRGSDPSVSIQMEDTDFISAHRFISSECTYTKHRWGKGFLFHSIR